MAKPMDLERAERARTGRMQQGFFWLGMGGMALAIGLMSAADWGDWMVGAGGAACIIGVVMAWSNRPGEAARLLAAAPGARDRAHRSRDQMLGVIPFAAVVFGALSVKAIAEIQAGTAASGDWIMIGVGLLYAWMGPLFVMGWDGGSLRHGALMQDELTRHHRARAIIAAFILLLALMSGLLGLGLWRSDLAIRLMPLALCLAGAAAALRFSWLERKAEGDDDAP